MTSRLFAVAGGIGAAVVLTGVIGGFSGAIGPGEALAGDGPIVVELFTSQSCYSCPPAEAFLGELVETRDDILALEFHVDYWDDLVYGAAGRWKDVFSDPAYTRRQVGYNQAIRGRAGVYTPQMVIHGEREAVGSRRREVNAALTAAAHAGGERLDIAIARGGDGRLTISINGTAAAPAAIWLVRYDRAHTTKVLRGENKGKTLTNRNVVRQVRHVGDWHGRPVTLELDDVVLDDNQGCAVLVQPAPQGAVLGAADCPAGRS